MTNLNAVFQFGVDNGYPQITRLRISPLKESRTIPDPLSQEEFIRLIDACRNQQAKIMVCFCLYWRSPGGAVCIWMGGHDLKKWNNDDQEKFSKRPFHGNPKTIAGTNQLVIYLIKPAIDALESR